MMNEAPSNQSPVNQAALSWLQEAKASPDSSVSYIAQLAMWGLDKNLVQIPSPLSPSQPDPHNVEIAIGALQGSGPEAAAFASQWFLSNPNLELEEQAESLAVQLDQAATLQEATEIAVMTAYDLMVAGNATSPDRRPPPRRCWRPRTRSPAPTPRPSPRLSKVIALRSP